MQQVAPPFASEAQVASGASQGAPNWVNVGSPFFFLPRPQGRGRHENTDTSNISAFHRRKIELKMTNDGSGTVSPLFFLLPRPHTRAGQCVRCYLKNKLSAASSSKQFGAVRSLMALRWRLPKGSQLGSPLFLLPRPHTRTGQGIVIVPVVFACIYLCAARANELHTSTAAAQFARGLPTVGPPCQGVGGSPRGSQLGSPPVFVASPAHQGGAVRQPAPQHRLRELVQCRAGELYSGQVVAPPFAPEAQVASGASQGVAPPRALPTVEPSFFCRPVHTHGRGMHTADPRGRISLCEHAPSISPKLSLSRGTPGFPKGAPLRGLPAPRAPTGAPMYIHIYTHRGGAYINIYIYICKYG